MTTLDTTQTEALADLLVRSIMSGDIETLRNEVYSPDVVIWHNFDQIEQRLEDNLKVMAWMGKTLTKMSYDEIHVQVTPHGYVQQHVLRGTTKSGVAIEVPACLIVSITDGKITRLDEYLDTAQVAALTNR
ncbi:MAG: nuclear transport factor 2 family protein [Ilumatobacteraceae bacterium]